MSENPNKFEQDLVSRLALASLREQQSRRRWGIFFKTLGFAYLIAVTVILLHRGDVSVPDYDGEAGVAAIVPIMGSISPGGENSADSINSRLRQAFKHQSVRGIVLQINSPGGSAVESNRVYKEINRLREKYPDKKVYAVAGDFCASGGYFIAAAADKIYADEASLVGSIGVIFSSFDFVEGMEKLGIKRRVITAGENKQFADPFSALDSENRAVIEDLLEDIHVVFIEAVRKGRGDRLQESDEVFNGRVYSGSRSVDIGLVDGIKDIGDVIRDDIGVEDAIYFEESDPLRSVLDALDLRSDLRGVLAR